MTAGPDTPPRDRPSTGSAVGRSDPDLGRARAFLRQHALPLLLSVQRRLRGAGHRATTQDLLDLDPPRLRLLVWPRPAPLRRVSPEKSTLELAWGTPDRWAYSARRWKGDDEAHPTHLASTPEQDVEPDWFRRWALEFLEDLMVG